MVNSANAAITEKLMNKYKAKNFVTREALEMAVIDDFGKTPEPKDAVIEGTIEELKKLNLSHSQFVWGVIASATDYTQQKIAERPKRGKIFKSKLNGITIKNATKKNKSRSKSRGA